MVEQIARLIDSLCFGVNVLVDRLGIANGDDDNVRHVRSGAVDTARRTVTWGVQLPQNDFHSRRRERASASGLSVCRWTSGDYRRGTLESGAYGAEV